jgi:hypothetical protein
MGKKNKKSEAAEEEVVVEEAAVEEVAEEAPVEEAAPEAPAEEAPAEEAPAAEAPAAEEAPSAPETVEASDGQIGTVAKPVNFRTGAKFTNAVIAELKAGTKIVISETVQGDKGAWYKCEFDGRVGFVKATGIIVG